VTYKFKAVRYGVAYKYHGKYNQPDVVGLFEQQTHTVSKWIPNYLLDSEKKLPIGAFVILEGWYFHSGSTGNGYTVFYWMRGDLWCWRMV
jgi:hypothetical protein